MKKKTLLKSIWILLVMCGVSANAGAQDLKSILSGVAKAVVGNKATTASSIIGTWTYSGPECQFESENLLAKAGGEMAAKEVEEKMIAVYNKVGMNNIRYTFNEDGTYSYQMKKRTVTGSYVFVYSSCVISPVRSASFRESIALSYSAASCFALDNCCAYNANCASPRSVSSPLSSTRFVSPIKPLIVLIVPFKESSLLL